MTGKPLWKPERRSAIKQREQRQHRLTRAQVRQLVCRREHGRCERCGRAVTFDCWPWEDRRAQVNDRVPRSLGGDPLSPANQELTCRRCHFPGGAHAPTRARMERLRSLAAKAKRLKQEARR